MRFRFVEMAPSDAPDFPFQPGQVVDMAVDARVRRWLRAGVIVPIGDDTETAMLGEPEETAVVERTRARGKR